SLIAKANAKLFDVRSKRVRPPLDDKSLTAWNGLMVKGYVDAYRAFGNQKWLDAALKNGHLTLGKIMQSDHSLRRNYKDGKSVINAFLDDYALTAEAFTALYQVTFDEKWLNAARELTDYAIQHFYDEKTGFFFYTSDLDPPLVARKMETSDNVIPGSNSLMASNLYVLGEYFYDEKYREIARGMMHKMASTMAKSGSPDYYSNWGRLYLQYVRPPFEVAIIGKDFAKKRDALLRNYLPNALLLGGSTEGSLELLKDKLQAGETMIYVCQNKVCKLPVKEVEKAIGLMGGNENKQ
ncbi:MAG: thioredoxin domain-containing protein, partial [Saprospiraceae bacterium]|nr:thioredoxin domain-containing protein [Saprospiraceae bacterium]